MIVHLPEKENPWIPGLLFRYRMKEIMYFSKDEYI